MATFEPASTTTGVSRTQQERPWLLPSNRRLRHLQGVSLRNLSLRAYQERGRGKTIDDDALPYTRKSPTKAFALREKKLEHAHSSTSLRQANGNPPETAVEDAKDDVPPYSGRPGVFRPRRRSTMDWATANTQSRQKKLENVMADRLLDTFVSLHVEGVKAPLYVSEEAACAMDPDFRLFDLNICSADITKRDTLTVKVWSRSQKYDDYHIHIELSVHLPSLQFVGKRLELFRHPLPNNCVLFHLTDGIYTSFTDLPSSKTIVSSIATPAPSASRTLPTAAYDTLMRLSTLDGCIQDALVMREKLAADISSLLEEHRKSLHVIKQVGEADESLKSTQHAVATRKRLLEAARKKLQERKASIKAREDAMEGGRLSEDRSRKATDLRELQHTRAKHQQRKEDIHGQRRRICEELQSIYPIEPLPKRSLAFTICGLHLPNAENLDEAAVDEVAASLGHAAHVVYSLSLYLSVPLPYPLHSQASTSTVEDPISIINERESRLFPLYAKGMVRYRFEYAVFLLNKDIETLLHLFGLRIMDIRQTLPNLKYLLYVATAGKGELPARKAGGYRGLLKSAGAILPPGSPLSRESSQDSARSNGEVGRGKGRQLLMYGSRPRQAAFQGSKLDPW